MRVSTFIVQYYVRKFVFLSRLRIPLLKKLYVNTFPAVHLKKMDSWDYIWHFSSELFALGLVLLVAGFNFALLRGPDQLVDKSIANAFLSYHASQNEALYNHTTATKTLVTQDRSIVPAAFASENFALGEEGAIPEEPETVLNDNTLVAQNPDSISELLKKQVKVYVTQPDDTLGSIGRKFSITIDTIKWANNLPNNNMEAGWSLLIPPEDGLIIEAGSNTTLEDIASRYKGNLEQIMAYNGIADVRDINPGDYIFCKGCIIPVTAPKPAPSTPTAKKQIGIADAIYDSGLGHIFPKGYCTWYVARRMKITFGGNARNWLTNGAAAGYETGAMPIAGAAVVTTDDRRYGHVAYVTKVTDTHIYIDEMNYVGFNKVSSRSIPLNSRTIRGYVYPKY